MGKENTKEKIPNYADILEKDDSWKNRIECILLAILDELRKAK